MRRAILSILLVTLLSALLAASAPAATLTPVGEFDTPVYVTSAPGDADRLYVVEQDGKIQLVDANGTTEFVDLGRLLGGGEQGLLSIAFPPDFATSRLLYVYYTGAAGSIRVGELASSGDTADLATLRDIISIPHPDFINHNGGQVQFGPDGYLYLAPGDGGGAGDPGETAQDLDGLLGKLLRIDPRPSGDQPYTVPPDNPFVGLPGADEIWSYGLRNPFRFSFDRLTGDLTIGDVGQDAWEEIDFAPRAGGGGRGVNWGWDCREGAHPFPETQGCVGSIPTDPVLEYPNGDSTCAVTGGYVVRDPGLTELYGRYLYADVCGREIRSAVLAERAASDDRPEGITVRNPVSFGEDACGRVYVVSLNGVVSRFEDGTPTDCTVVQPPPPPAPEGRCGPIVRGGDGDDSLRGGPGGQDVIGLGGDDSLRGEAGADCVEGNGGRDSIRGGEGFDELIGGAGRDEIDARDGERDSIACGRGRDRVRADAEDRVRGCDRGTRR